MRICLTSKLFPPYNTEGIPRQRYVLANALTRLGHDVHVITSGETPNTFRSGRVTIHTIPGMPLPINFSKKYANLNNILTYSLEIQKQIRNLNHELPFDILDVPIWGLEGFIPIYAGEMPVVLWLQTTRTQLVSLDNRQPYEDEIGVMRLEKESLMRADNIIADSEAILSDLERLLDLNGIKERSRVIHLGIPDLPESDRLKRHNGKFLEALVVGRLEKRKGTQLLFNILPQLLKEEKRLRIRFVGPDNSNWDGFYNQFRQTYAEYFLGRWPEFQDRVIFEGKVSEERLIAAYNQADIMLVPSLYESFGLVYLEAMRSALPVITFDAGAVKEIFPRGQEDGGLIIPLENVDALQIAIHKLINDSIFRNDLGRQGRERFLSTFLDIRMAEETVTYYQEILEKKVGQNHFKPRFIVQVMEALDVGDAVSTIALKNEELLQKMGAGGTILGIHAHPQIAHRMKPVHTFILESNAALIFHYWNYTHLEEFIHKFKGPKAIHFHNITPPEYFYFGTPGYEATSRGYQQLPQIINLFDLIIGVSTFNLEVCQRYLEEPKPAIVIPPVINPTGIRSIPYDDLLYKKIHNMKGCKFIFVGRIARNKRQDRIMEAFNTYQQQYDHQAWLFLIGNECGDIKYREELEELRQKLPSKDRILFTGKVSEAALYSYYRAANVFLCASEHEGFCVPILEAMALDVPVIAYAAAAVPETMGNAGVRINEWDNDFVAETVNKIIGDSVFHQRIVEGQRTNLTRFSINEVAARLQAVVRYLQMGEKSSLIELLAPVKNTHKSYPDQEQISVF